MNVQIRTKGLKSDIYETKRVNEKIGNVNETVQSVISSMIGNELESINITIKCNKEVNKHKETSSSYDNKGE